MESKFGKSSKLARDDNEESFLKDRGRERDVGKFPVITKLKRKTPIKDLENP